MAQEKNFENKIKKYLEDNGCWFIKYWSGASFTKVGIPDILVSCNGYFLAVEVKAPNGKPSELQIYNIKKIIASGGVGVILYPKQYEDFKLLVSRLMNGYKDDALEIAKVINRKWVN